MFCRTVRVLSLSAVIVSLFASPEVRAGTPWVLQPRPTTVLLNSLSFIDSLNGFIAGDEGVILKTTNGGTSWVECESGVLTTNVDVFMADARHAWVLSQKYAVDTNFAIWTTLLRTTDGGEEWIQTRFDNILYHTLTFLDSLNGWMGGENGLFVRTTNGGEDWTEVEVDSSVYSGFPIRSIRFFSRSTGYAVGCFRESAAALWQSADSGLSWQTSGGGAELYDIHYIDSLNMVGVGGGFDDGTIYAISSDGGKRWTFGQTGFLGQGNALSFRTSREGWAPLGFTGQIMMTLDSGRTWESVYTPDSSGMVDVQFTDSLHGFMVGERGTILRYGDAPVSVSRQGTPTRPATPMLRQNFPNPFNPATTIVYELPERSTVVITITTLTGQVVDRFVDRSRGPGRNTFHFDGRGLPSGTYFYSITAMPVSRGGPGITETGKMVLIR